MNARYSKRLRGDKLSRNGGCADENPMASRILRIEHLVFCIALTLMFAPYALAVASFDAVKNSYDTSDAVLLDRHGEVLHEIRIDDKTRKLRWISLAGVSPALAKAVLGSEDRRFYRHGGVDLLGVLGAVRDKIISGRGRGASTITMQLASMLDGRLNSGSGRRDLSQKWRQMRAAWAIERTWEKDEILEAYLNLAAWRGELQGVSAASRGLFGKDASGINSGEALILASLIRSPNARAGDVAKRACRLGEAMKSETPCREIESLAVGLAGAYFIKPQVSLAPHAAKKLLGIGRLKAASTLDKNLQAFALQSLQYQLSSLRDKNVRDGAVIVLDNHSGDTLAYVGNGARFSSARFVDGITARRQAGSTLKPFLYELAIERRIITAASPIEDSPLDIPTPLGLYMPENYDNSFRGFVSVRTALSSSLNIPAVKTLMLVGEGAFIERLKALGFRGLNQSGDYYGFSLALGSADVMLLDLANAYRTLANGGLWSAVQMSLDGRREMPARVMSADGAFIVSDILSDREARSATFGLENPLSTRFWTAVKTGTSKDMRDNWCVGFSAQYTVGVWVGNFSGEPMWSVTGITGAAPIWLEVMNYLHRSAPSVPPAQPDGVISNRIEFKNSIEPPRVERFISGTESDLIEISRRHAKPSILYPPDKTVFALDPDIPADRQIIFFEAEGAEGKFIWELNGRKIASSSKTVSWKPKSGKYVLSLADSKRQMLDSVEFWVK
ncbi:MAG: penicillin-binding protein 1C [Deltaproteobacteria bacterium]